MEDLSICPSNKDKINTWPSEVCSFSPTWAAKPYRECNNVLQDPVCALSEGQADHGIAVYLMKHSLAH